MSPIRLNIKTNTHKYPIIIGSNLIGKITRIIQNNSIKIKRSLLIIKTNISKKKYFKDKKVFK